jgi:hypothetical protein
MREALESVGRVVVLTLQVLARMLDLLGSSGAVGPGAAPLPASKKPDEYRP